MSDHTPAPYRPRSVYGYALFIGSNIVFFLYIIWAVVPDEILHDRLGLTYWPLKYWAVAIPIWILTAIAVFAFIIYPAINLLMTPDIDDVRTIKDQYSLVQNINIPGSIPSVSDIPITDNKNNYRELLTQFYKNLLHVLNLYLKKIKLYY